MGRKPCRSSLTCSFLSTDKTFSLSQCALQLQMALHNKWQSWQKYEAMLHGHSYLLYGKQATCTRNPCLHLAVPVVLMIRFISVYVPIHFCNGYSYQFLALRSQCNGSGCKKKYLILTFLVFVPTLSFGACCLSDAPLCKTCPGRLPAC